MKKQINVACSASFQLASNKIASWKLALLSCLAVIPVHAQVVRDVTVNAADNTLAQPLVFFSANVTPLTAALAGVYQPLDADLTALAALATTPFGRSLATQADAAALRATLGMGIGDISGLAAALDAKMDDSQASVFGLSLLDDADAATARATLALGNVDNTSDASKPVSAATQAALNLKADLTSPVFPAGISFEGATVDANETTLSVADPTADQTIVIPNQSGTLITTGNIEDLVMSNNVSWLRDEFGTGTIVSGQVGQLGWIITGTGSALEVGASQNTGDFGGLTFRPTGITSALESYGIYTNFGFGISGGASIYSDSTQVRTLARVYLSAINYAFSYQLGKENSGPPVVGKITSPNSAGIRFIPRSTAAWVTLTSYVVGDNARPTVENGLKYICTTAGLGGALEPTWPTTYGATIADGLAVWTCAGSDGRVDGKWEFFVTGADAQTNITTAASTITASASVVSLRLRISSNTAYFSVNNEAEVSIPTAAGMGLVPAFLSRNDGNATYPDTTISLWALFSNITGQPN